GIGKTRLTEEFAARAAGRGFGVHVGRCSSDEGAPPLWPWVTVLGSLARTRTDELLAEPIDLLRSNRAGGADRFTQFDAVAKVLERIVAGEPQILVFDDLHWADPSTLSLLRHVTDTVEHGHLVLVATRRAHPAPTGALAEYGESLARRHALRLDLTGLTTTDVGELAASGRSTALLVQDADRLRDRTGGNPFFLLELLRAGPDTMPAAVGDVIGARVGRLPATTQRALRAAAALGRTIDPDLLAIIEQTDPDQALDALEPALEAGLLTVTAAGELRFGHALVRDAVEATDSPLRRQRRHAAIARALLDRDAASRHLAEIARHWMQAGPAQAQQAWPAAVAAAAHATGLAAHEEAADLLAAALVAQTTDPGADLVARYELLLTRAAACRAAADNTGQRAATTEAIEIARRLGDVERVAAAAIAAAEGGLWSNVPEGTQHSVTVEALRGAARDLPGGDTALRCRVFLALSRELFWAAPGGDGHPAERTAHAERGFAMARRLGEPRLRSFACQTLSLAVIYPATLDRRIELTEESIECARAAGDPNGEGVGLFWRVVFAGEAGRIDDRRVAVAEALDHVERHGLRMLQVMLGAHQASWLALEGRFDEADALLDDQPRRAALASFPFREEAVQATRAFIELWRGRPVTMMERFDALAEASYTDVDTAVLIGLIRSGRLDAAAARMDRASGLPLNADDFAAPFDFGILAEATLVLGRPELAGRHYPMMLPWSGRMAAAGPGPPLGPVDGFLAAAAAAVGEVDLASRHADDAARLCVQWRMPPVAAWLRDLRSRFGF
ncbi:MAG TPA: AAA family ATPase, partial [Nakamurella sp.]